MLTLLFKVSDSVILPWEEAFIILGGYNLKFYWGLQNKVLVSYFNDTRTVAYEKYTASCEPVVHWQGQSLSSRLLPFLILQLRSL